MPYSRGKKLEDETSEEIIDTAYRIACSEGVKSVTVNRILTEMRTSNRVFYNRFKDINEVMDIVAKRAALRMQRCFFSQFSTGEDYIKDLMRQAETVLDMTYAAKGNMSGYMFDKYIGDTAARTWWIENMQPVLDMGVEHGVFNDVDMEKMAFVIWSFCAGFNAIVSQDNTMTRDEAMEIFRLGFGCLLKGMRKTT